jgi:hypothetical protein
MTDREPLPSAYATRTELREARARIVTTLFNNLVDNTKKNHYSMLEYWLHDGCFLTALGVHAHGPRYALVTVSKFEDNTVGVKMEVNEKSATEYLSTNDYFGRLENHNGLITLEKTITDPHEMEVARTEMAYALRLAKIEGLERSLARTEANLMLLAISPDAQLPEQDQRPLPMEEDLEDRPVRARRSRPVDYTGREREPMM